jgi:hypothetical protein
MDKVKNPGNPKCYTLSSKLFRIYPYKIFEELFMSRKSKAVENTKAVEHPACTHLWYTASTLQFCQYSQSDAHF